MRVIKLLLLLVCTTSVQAQQFTISGQIDGLTDSLLFLYRDGTRDTAALRHGHFTFSGQVPHPQEVHLFNGKGYSITLFVENAPMQLKGHKDAPGNIKVTGSKSQQEYEAFLQMVKPATDKMDVLFDLFQKDKTKKDSIMDLSSKILETEYNPLAAQFIHQHPNSYVSLYKLKELMRTKPLADMERAFTRLSAAVRTSDAGKAVQEEFDIMHKTETGKPAIDFSMNTPDGKPIRLSSYKGSYVLLEFWASWCGPCRKENPALKKTYERFKGRNFRILGVSLDKDSSAWVKAIAADGLPWDHVSDLGLWENSAAKLYNIKSIPANFLINPDGVIIAKDLDGHMLEQQLAELMK